MKVEFLSSCDVRILTPDEVRARGAKEQLYEVLRDIVIIIDNHMFVVPKAFVTNFVSTHPTIRWYVGNENPTMVIPSLIHDYQYASGGLYGKYTRKQSDKMYCDMMIYFGEKRFKASLVYIVLRLAGWTRWKKYPNVA